MGGLINGAKAKIWEIARRAQEGKPAPQVRIGLVAYRDRGDEYVTKVVDLTGDLDTIYARLTELQANGGGDTPEHVLKGLHDAVDDVTWSSDPQAVKLVYLVGDAPPHYDYNDGITLDGVLSDAKQKGIRISAIRCGNASDTLVAWTTIAQRSDGEVATIDQNSGVVAVATPYDAELARLNGELAKTEVHWGSHEEQARAAKVLIDNVTAAPAAQADRAGFYSAHAKAGGGATKNDLAADPTALARVSEGDLPDELRNLSGGEREQFVAKKRAERDAVLAQIRTASDKREAYLKTSAPKPAATALDTKVYDSLRKAGADKGISF
jgi:hypothetical protein